MSALRGWFVAGMLCCVALVCIVPVEAHAQNMCHIVGIDFYKQGPSSLILDVDPNRTNVLHYGGTIQPGVYAVAIELAASSTGAAPGTVAYCNISASATFDLSTSPNSLAPEDLKARTVTAFLSGFGIPATNNTVSATDQTNFSAYPSRSDEANSQYALGVVAHHSTFSGDGFSISGSVRGYASNQYLQGFPFPSGHGKSRIYWRFVVDAVTDWAIDVDMTVHEGPGTSATAAYLPLNTIGGVGTGVLQYVGLPDQSFLLAPLPATSLLTFTANNPALFLGITSLPDELDVSGFEVGAGGLTLGPFAPGAAVDFVSATGGGVSSFTLAPQSLVDPGQGPLPYVLGLDLDSPTADWWFRCPSRVPSAESS